MSENQVILYPAGASIKLDAWTTAQYHLFLQRMCNRRTMGAMRYEDRPNPFKNYLTRLKKELKKYEETGNIEHLYNIGNYAFLECVAPESGVNTFDPTVESVTRTSRKRKV